MEREILSALGKKHPQVVVAGGAGPLGTGISFRLLKFGFNVVVIDNLSSDQSSGFPKLEGESRFSFIKADITDGLPEGLENVDFVFHLAKLETDVKKDSDGLTSLLTNAEGTKNLLELARRNRARFLLASWIDIYRKFANVSYHPEFFSSDPDKREKLYSLVEGKQFAEALVWEYIQRHDLNARIVRLGNIYGSQISLPEMGVLGRLISNLLAGEDLVVEGEGTRKLYYVYYTAALDGLLAAMFAKGTSDSVYPISPRKPITELELAYLVKEHAPKRTKVVFQSSSNVPDLPSLPIPNKAEKELGWEAEPSLVEGVEKTVKSYRRKRAEERIDQPLAESSEETPAHAPKQKILSPLKRFFGVFPSQLCQVTSLVTKRAFLSLVSLCVVGVFLFVPLFLYLFCNWRGEQALFRAESNLSSFHVDTVIADADQARAYFSSAEEKTLQLSWFFNLIFSPSNVTKISGTARAKEYLAESLYYTGEALSLVKTKLIFDQSGVSYPVSEDDFLQATNDLIQARRSLLLSQAELAEDQARWQSFLTRMRGHVSFVNSLYAERKRWEEKGFLRQKLKSRGWVEK
ncbi:MAG: NAD-dependent epimerase/dehydratase family protein [Patescibacteria group bacterium]